MIFNRIMSELSALLRRVVSPSLMSGAAIEFPKRHRSSEPPSDSRGFKFAKQGGKRGRRLANEYGTAERG